VNKWATGLLVYLVALAAAVRVSAEMLTPALPLLLVLLGLALVFRRMWRGF
jgi:hypothetical protein